MSENSEDEAPSASLEVAARLLSLAYAVISVLWLIWILIPEHKRRLMAMQAAETARKFTARAAFRTGHQAMGLEISGRGENYKLPFALSVARDKAAAVYEKMRYTS